MRDVLRVASDCVALVGGVLIILAVAVGLTNYLVNAQVPMKLIDWTQAHIQSRWVFLLCLNVFLLLVGTLMDIFSAIVVVVPLIIPLAQAFDLNLVHLGMIFIANLELGYLHPPLGLNLLLASVPLQEAGARGHVGHAADARHPGDWRAAHHVCADWLTMGLLHLMGRG